MAPKGNAKSKGKAGAEEKKGDGKVKQSQYINVRHILVSNSIS